MGPLENAVHTGLYRQALDPSHRKISDKRPTIENLHSKPLQL
jgi:hypothetical protein